MAEMIHILPTADLIEHEESDDCPCGPTSEPQFSEDIGACGWVIVHHSLDGRELSE